MRQAIEVFGSIAFAVARPMPRLNPARDLEAGDDMSSHIGKRNCLASKLPAAGARITPDVQI
jgi:hypothetical protein